MTQMADKDIGLMMHERDRKRASHLFRTASLGKSMSLDVPDRLLGQFEPDWTKFEAVFSKELTLDNSQPCTKPLPDNNPKQEKDVKNQPSGKGDNKGGIQQDWSLFEEVYAKDLLPASQGYQKTSDFMLQVFSVLMDYVKKNNDRGTKILDFHHPHTLKEMMGHCLDIQEDPQNLEQILSDCKETLKYCVKTGHPRFFNQLSTGLDMIALAGEWLTATANTNMFTYEIAPVFTLMEDIVLTKMRELVGWPNGDGDGIFAPGGAISNLYAVAVARHHKCPDVKMKGMGSLPRLVMFTSEGAHFSIKRAGALLGIGTENVILIKTDEKGRIIPADLEARINEAKENGGVPFFVSATGGTTVLGAFDPIPEMADICERHDIWFHVDCAWGGGALVSPTYRKLLVGIERANSVTWNPHKLMGCLLQCSAILLRDKGQLEACNSLKATYLFQPDKHYDVVYDTGDKAIQCGRHNDVFKLWLMWRANGDTGFETRIDELMELSKHLQRLIREKEGFEFVMEDPVFINVCFWYIPKNIRHLPKGKERDEKVDKVAPKIKAMMMENGSTMVGYQPMNDLPNFFRMIISNPASTHADIDFLMDEIERLGEEI